jgi:chromosome partitioning protein
MKVTVLANKGGVGKSTLSILLHEALKKAGKSVIIRDWDIQGTSNKALALILSKETDPVIHHDIIIYDTPPNLEHGATIAAVKNADFAFVVVSPSPADIWEAEKTVQFVRAQNSKAVIRLIFNKVRKGTLLGRLIDESAKQISAPTLKSMLSYRECYQHALGEGWKALDGAAREEVLALAISITTIKPTSK